MDNYCDSIPNCDVIRFQYGYYSYYSPTTWPWTLFAGNNVTNNSVTRNVLYLELSSSGTQPDVGSQVFANNSIQYNYLTSNITSRSTVWLHASNAASFSCNYFNNPNMTFEFTSAMSGPPINMSYTWWGPGYATEVQVGTRIFDFSDGNGGATALIFPWLSSANCNDVAWFVLSPFQFLFLFSRSSFFLGSFRVCFATCTNTRNAEEKHKKKERHSKGIKRRNER